MSPHGHHAHDTPSVSCGIITVSDTRSEADDTSGQRIRALLEEQHHRVDYYRIVKDEPERIAALVRDAPPSVEVLVCNGGTGVARRDTTYEAIARLLEKEIPGFGELFRMLSYEQIGAAAMLSRATAGVAGRRVIFSLPGSTKAVELAMTKLILPQLGHVVGLVRDFMTVRLRFFASLRERLKSSAAEYTLADGATVGDLWAALCRERPDLDALSKSISFAVNREYVERGQVLSDGDEVALIPPVSGGR